MRNPNVSALPIGRLKEECMYQGDFLNTVEEILQRLTISQCRAVIARMARGCEASGRAVFLDKLHFGAGNPELSIETEQSGGYCSDRKSLVDEGLIRLRIASLMRDVRHFIKRMEDGDFTEYDEEGGWDSEEAWTDEDDVFDGDNEGCACDEDDEDDHDDKNDDDDVDDVDVATDRELLWTSRGSTVQQEVLLMLRRAQNLAFEGCPDSAAVVFSLLLPALTCDEVQFTFGSALESALAELAPLHLHLLVSLHEAVEACPAVRQMMEVHAALVGWPCLSLDAIRGSGRMQPEQWKQFLDAFLVYLVGQKDAISGQLLREGIRMRDGMDALLEHVRALGAATPEAWREALALLVEQKAPGELIGAFCLEMLSVYGLPVDDPAAGALSVVAFDPEVASFLLPAAQYLVEQGAEVPAWRSIGLQVLVDIDPSPLHLAAWMQEKRQNGHTVREMAECVLMHRELHPKKVESTRSLGDSANQTISRFLFLLCRCPLELQQSVKKRLPYGWSDGNESSFHFAWTLVFLMAQRFPDRALEQILDSYPCIRYFWDALTAALCRSSTLTYRSSRSFDIYGRYEKISPVVASLKKMQQQQMERLIFEAMRLHSVGDDVSEKLETWLKNMMYERVEFILQNKHRGAYDRVARACIACAVLMSERHGEEVGKALLESILKSRVRFHAFTGALRRETATGARRL